MKYVKLMMIILIQAAVLSAQWTPVSNGLPGAVPTSMFAFLDTLMLGTAGGGIFKTTDQGSNWMDISGNIGNKNINDIRGGGGSKVIWAATEGGVFYTNDQTHYSNNSSTGLTVLDANYYWFGTEGDAEWAVGTAAGGLFTSADLAGPWNNASAGLSENGLIINDLSGYDSDEINFAVLATDGGVYFADSSLSPWTPKNNGLSGSAFQVKKLSVLGSYVLAATQGGLFYSADFGDQWTAFIIDEKFNTVSFVQTTLVPYGIAVLAFGTNGYISLDLLNFSPIDMSGVSGEVTCFALTSTEIYIGVNDGSGSGQVYKRQLDQIVSLEDAHGTVLKNCSLAQNYPNPFNPATLIRYRIGTAEGMAAEVELSIYNNLGQQVATLFSGRLPAGQYEIEWNATGLASGVYYCCLRADHFRTTRKIVLLR